MAWNNEGNKLLEETLSCFSFYRLHNIAIPRESKPRSLA